MKGALLNPIRFYDSANMPDYLTYFPNFDNTTYGEGYFYGINPSPDCIRTHIGDMFLQFLNEDNAIFTMNLYKLNDNGNFDFNDAIDSVNISPTGWIGYQIHSITISDLEDGFYYLKNSNYKSDIFRITSETIITEDLIKIKYANSVNDFGCIFGTNYFTSYFIGNLQPGEIKTEIESFEGDRGEPIKLKSTPQRTATINIFGLHHNYKDLIELIFSCDTIEINDVLFVNLEAPTYEDIDGSDLMNISVKLVQSNNDYYGS